jgi:hypothetical protein
MEPDNRDTAPSHLAMEVVWPLHRRHYLCVPEEAVRAVAPAAEKSGNRYQDPPPRHAAEERIMADMTDKDAHDLDSSPAPEVVPADQITDVPEPRGRQARALAVSALLAGACCTRVRVGRVLGISTRTLGRDLDDAPQVGRLGDAPVVERAAALIAESASRGSTSAERDAAHTWLREEAAGVPRAIRPRPQTPPRAHAPDGTATPRRTARRNGRGLVRRPEADVDVEAQTVPSPTWSPDQVNTLRRDQRRILGRSLVIHSVLAGDLRLFADEASREPCSVSQTLAELLDDITEAARHIGEILDGPVDQASP